MVPCRGIGVQRTVRLLVTDLRRRDGSPSVFHMIEMGAPPQKSIFRNEMHEWITLFTCQKDNIYDKVRMCGASFRNCIDLLGPLLRFSLRKGIFSILVRRRNMKV